MSLKLTLANCKNRVCPWSKRKVSRDSLLLYRSNVFGFSTIESSNKFRAATDHFDELAKQYNGKKIKNVGSPLNSHCPWSQKAVSHDSLTEYLSFTVGFCNSDCRDTFATARSVFDDLIEESAVVREGAEIETTPTKRKRVSPKSAKKDDDAADIVNDSHRCSWARDPVFHHYHDTEWGVPSRGDDRYLFEMLILEGAQAGLSWKTILNKRESYKSAFDNFDIETVAKYDEEKILSLLENKGIVRNKLKVRSAVTNAQATLQVCAEFGSFSNYMWGFVNNEPIRNSPLSLSATTSLESDALSKDLKKRGFKFVGSTIMYAYMQAVGMVDDHEDSCQQKQK